MTKEMIQVVETAQLEASKAKTILDQFTGFFEKAQEWEKKAHSIVVTDESQVVLMQQAKAAAKELQQIRISTENTRKALKETALREGQVIDGIANVIKGVIIPLESHLLAQAKYVENKQKEREAELLETRRAFLANLLPEGADMTAYNLGGMSVGAFDALIAELSAAKRQRDDEVARVEKERIAALKAQEAEQARIVEENKKLKAEADERNAILEQERQQRIEAEAKIAAAKDQEEALIREKKKSERAAKLRPDKDKLNAYADAIEAVVAPLGMDVEGTQAVDWAKRQLSAVADGVRAMSNKMQ